MAALLAKSPVAADWHREEAAIMGTAVAVELWTTDAAQGRALTRSVLDEMRRIDRLMSTYRPDSELSRVNMDAAGQPVRVSTEMLALIKRALGYSVTTHGAFDITYASAGQHYDFRTGRKPDTTLLSGALPAIDYRHVVVDEAGSTIRFLHPGVRIDLGGIAKGYGVERCIALLADAGITNALVSAGGDTRGAPEPRSGCRARARVEHGRDRRERSWRREPEGPTCRRHPSPSVWYRTSLGSGNGRH